MSISDKYLGFLHFKNVLGFLCLGNAETTFRRVQLKSDYLKILVNLIQYLGAVGNFNKRKFFNTKAVNNVFGHRY